jgi:uncharacterized LabA/DUF88 family protein
MNNYIEKFKGAVKGKVFIFIDAANLERSVQSMWVNPKDIFDILKNNKAEKLCWKVDYQKLEKFFKNVCNAQKIRFYSAEFQTENHNKFLSFLKKALGFKLKTKPLKEYKDHTAECPHRKANFDVEIAVDATYHLKEYDTFILFSGDCDFEYLLKFLRGQNKITIVFSRTGHVAKELPPACNYYFDIVDFRNEILKIDIKKK